MEHSIQQEAPNQEHSRQQIIHLKSDIKVKVSEQIELKRQRKSVHFKGVRHVSPDVASAMHHIYRRDLRHMYIAYGFMRGKTFQQIESKDKENYSVVKVQDIITKYASSTIHINP